MIILNFSNSNIVRLSNPGNFSYVLFYSFDWLLKLFLKKNESKKYKHFSVSDSYVYMYITDA